MKFIFLILGVYWSFIGVHDTQAQSTPPQLLQLEINKTAADPSLKYGQLGISIQSVKTGKVVARENASKSIIPASNLKLITTATALKVLGEDFTFQTKLEYDGVVTDGILNGNIFITGGGDPSLGSDRIKGGSYDINGVMALFVQKIKDFGIKKIKGYIVADASIFEINPLPDNWTWGDIGNYYGAGVYGLNINENLYRVYFKSGKQIGDTTDIAKVSPFIPQSKFVNEVTTAAAGSGDKAYIYTAPRSGFVYMNGTIPLSAEPFPVRGAIPDPPYLCAFTLKNELAKNGIFSDSSAIAVYTPVNAGYRKNIYTYNSPKLKELINLTNVFSLNLYAESLLKMIGLKSAKEASTKAGLKALQDFWRQKGVDMGGFFIYDGSGLSFNNSITANQMSSILTLMATDPAFASFYNSLPVAGVSGTVYKLCKGTCAERNARVKSGTLNKVTCYSGYVNSKSGELYTFSMMVNNFEGSSSAVISKLEKIIVRIAELE